MVYLLFGSNKYLYKNNKKRVIMASIGNSDNKNTNKNYSWFNLSKKIKNIMNFGLNYDAEIANNPLLHERKRTESNVKEDNVGMMDMFSMLTNNNVGVGNSSLVNYGAIRNNLRLIAEQDEIENILDIVCDETIINNTATGKFCGISPISDMSDEINKDITEIFDDIYSKLGFNSQNIAWEYFRKLMIDGTLAFEIVYDENNKIKGFIEIDTACLERVVNINTGEVLWNILNVETQDDSNGTIRTRIIGNTMVNGYPTRMVNGGSVNNMQNNGILRTLHDNQIIYLRYSSMTGCKRISYVERLIRSFNVLRTMEATRLIWSVTNCSYKMKFVIPVGQVSTQKGERKLAESCARYKELVNFNWENGEIQTNGKPMMPFFKEYWFPSVNGDQPDISTLDNNGPDVNDTTALDYFRNKLKDASKIPYSRFDKEGVATYTSSAEGIQRDEIRFYNFITRLRTIYKDLLLKPIYIALCIKHPELDKDMGLRNKLSLVFTDNLAFNRTREVEAIDKSLQTVGSLQQIADIDAEGNQIPYFDLDFLVKRFSGIDAVDLLENEKIKKRKKLKGKYKPEDIDKIVDQGADEKDFEPLKKGKDGGEGGGDDGGEGGGAPIGGGGGGAPDEGGAPDGGEGGGAPEIENGIPGL